MTTRTRTVLAANVAPGMRVRRSNHLDWTTIPEAPSAYGWPRASTASPPSPYPLGSAPPGASASRGLRPRGHPGVRVAGGAAPCGGSPRGSGCVTTELAAAASGTITVPAPPPVASHPRPKRKA